jgi:DNA primase
MSSAAEQIKGRLGIVEVVGSYIKLEKSGASFKACCPFHNEKTPSFYVSSDRNSYYCFGCGAKGDIFTFVQEFEKVDFVGALKILADRAGIDLPSFKGEPKGEMDRLRNVLDEATQIYQNELLKNKDASSYLFQRGLIQKTIDDWRIGFAPNDWRFVFDRLVKKKISVDDIEKVGLIKWPDNAKANGQIDSKNKPYDRFRSRIIFPLFDPSSRVIGFSGRIFGLSENEGPKYLNSPETSLFNKSEVLYGYNKAKEGIRQWGYVILVEGQMDMLMCHQSGFTNTVATSGTSLTSGHLEKLSRMTNNMMLVYDSDKAGIKATLRAWTEALSFGLEVKIANLPAGDDPASVLQKDKDIFKEALKNSKNIIEYYLDILLTESQKEQDEVKRKDVLLKKIRDELLPYLGYIDSSISRSNYISKVSLKTGISEKDLQEDLAMVLKKVDIKSSDKSSDKISLGVNGHISGQVSISDKDILKDPVIRRITGLVQWLNTIDNKNLKSDEIIDRIKKVYADEYENLKNVFDDRNEELIFEAEAIFKGNTNMDREINDLLYSMEEKFIKDKLSKSMLELQLSEKVKNKKRSEELLGVCQELSTKLSDLNKKKSLST